MKRYGLNNYMSKELNLTFTKILEDDKSYYSLLTYNQISKLISLLSNLGKFGALDLYDYDEKEFNQIKNMCNKNIALLEIRNKKSLAILSYISMLVLEFDYKITINVKA